MMQAPLAKLRSVFEGHSFSRLSTYAGQAASDVYECCQFCVPEVDWMGQGDRTREVTSNSAFVTCTSFPVGGVTDYLLRRRRDRVWTRVVFGNDWIKRLNLVSPSTSKFKFSFCQN